MIDLRYLKPGDIVRVDRGDEFFYGFVSKVEPGGSERFPEREIVLLPCVLPGGFPGSAAHEWYSCTRQEVTGVWRADAQTRRAHPQGADAYDEWARNVNPRSPA